MTHRERRAAPRVDYSLLEAGLSLSFAKAVPQQIFRTVSCLSVRRCPCRTISTRFVLCWQQRKRKMKSCFTLPRSRCCSWNCLRYSNKMPSWKSSFLRICPLPCRCRRTHYLCKMSVRYQSYILALSQNYSSLVAPTLPVVQRILMMTSMATRKKLRREIRSCGLEKQQKLQARL